MVEPQNLHSVHRFAVATAVATFVLLVAGALVTSNDAGLSVPDWPLSHGSLMPEMVGGVFYEHSHRLIAATVAILTLILAIWLSRAERRPQVRRLGWTAVGMVLAQALLGGVTVLLYLPVAISVLHACLAQLFFCTVVVIA
jgi:cytochrome c oxidase assembly protein subunit 15